MGNSALTQTDFTLPGQQGVYHGKVRDVYDVGNHLVIVATDRISAFDVILPKPIPFKGQVLNQTAAFFLRATADIAPNWLLDTPDPNVSIGLRCEPFKVEMVIRDCLVGHSWREYNAGKRELCGAPMPEGLKEFDRFPAPIITPSTKAEAGHDEDISPDEIVERGLATKSEFEQLSKLARDLFAKGQNMAKARGLYLADTKYEFGKHDGKIYLIDEVHTPDSSRYFYADGYEAFLHDRGQPEPKHLSKEFVREWLMDNGFHGQTGQQIPDMTEEFVQSVSDRYIELYESITGEKFAPPSSSDEPLARIEKNITQALKQLK